MAIAEATAHRMSARTTYRLPMPPAPCVVISPTVSTIAVIAVCGGLVERSLTISHMLSRDALS
jgi:hypothetical protein